MRVDVVRKDIKNVHLAVYPPKGRVRIAAPRRLSEDAIRLAIVTRLGWIRRQQRAFGEQDREGTREIVSGESHYIKGRRYRLNVVEREAPPTVAIRGTRKLNIFVRPGSSLKVRSAVLERWYRARLREQAADLFKKWEPLVGVRAAAWGIRRMRTRWGTCNTESSRIWINLELAKKPPVCLEYIIVHELVHLRERAHSDLFRALLDGLLPRWRSARDELNRAPLAHEEWTY
jgi:predicted metal-dependent hydrolase